ncbi:Phage protein [Staphylococcus aureus]|uniref:Phage protein n=3 Tax=root TaxID=1 RepID=A0A380EDP4_STAAU|nr:Phage protein [Staphylococcus aureus]
MNNREKIEQSVISASAYNGNDTEGLLKEIEDVYKKAQAFDEILKGLPNAMQDALKEDIGLDEAVGIMTGQVVYKYEEEQEMKKFNVQITYAGMIEETIEAESLEEAEIEADFIAIFEASFNYDEYEINVEEAQENE